ncbi:GPI mannosyltransferase 2 [Dictyocoela muelleri]|nr:GPI mannosyltransferase 2 [Dictyocoela muelleri]
MTKIDKVCRHDNYFQKYNKYFIIATIFIISRIIYISIGYISSLFINSFDKSAINMPFLIRWDSIYFVKIAKYGYKTEQMLAFFPLLPLTIKFISKIFKIELELVGIILNNVLFFVNTLLILYISTIINPDNSFISTLLFIFSPASIIHSTIYTESLFMFLFLLSFLFYIWSFDNKDCQIDLFITPFNMNYDLSGYNNFIGNHNSNNFSNKKIKRNNLESKHFKRKVNLRKRALEIRDKIKQKKFKNEKFKNEKFKNEKFKNKNFNNGKILNDQKSINSKKQDLNYYFSLFLMGLSGLCRSNAMLFSILPIFNFISISELIFESLICNFGVILFQIYSFFKTGKKHFLTYNYIQKEYWGQGFLRFYRYKKNIPNFFVGLPFIIFFLVYIFNFFKSEYRNFLKYRKLKSRICEPEETKNIDINYKDEIINTLRDMCKYCKRRQHILYLVCLLLLQVILAIFFIHTHMIFRFVSYNPIVYWFLADFYQNGSLISEFVIFNYFNWSIIYTILFCCYFPPA